MIIRNKNVEVDYLLAVLSMFKVGELHNDVAFGNGFENSVQWHLGSNHTALSFVLRPAHLFR